MFVSTTAPPSSSSFLLGGSSCSYCLRCHVEPMICSISHGFSRSLIKAPCEQRRVSQCSGLSFKRENLSFGTSPFYASQISVAADYSDSVPDSSSYATSSGYHPLEELKDHGRSHDTMPSSAEIARTAVQANSRALLVVPSSVHSEPHEQISWAEFEYIIDDFGDIFFEVYDGHNILQDHEASNPVTALIGMDISYYESRYHYDYNILDFDAGDDVLFAADYSDEKEPSKIDILTDWGMPGNPPCHPVYFAKCLTKAIDVEHTKLMDHPSNGVAVWGVMKPTFIDQESYLRGLFNDEAGDIDTSDSKDDGRCGRSTIYRLGITKIELLSVYGVQSIVGVQDFQYAEPDVLVYSQPSILERFRQTGTRCSVALQALCKKKGLHVEGANLIGVDSLGMDVRVSSGKEVRTHRFAFETPANTQCAADEQIQQLLFPMSRRKKLNTPDKSGDGSY